MSEILVDVTDQVDFQLNDDESLPLTKCVCGEKFRSWDEIIGIYKGHPWKCPKCGARLIFAPAIRVYQVKPPPQAAAATTTAAV